MPRYKLTIEYDGTPFFGWQIQDNGPSVQGALIEAIAAFSGERVAVNGAGRTDAGVHALGQVAHVDLAKEWDTDTVRDAINAHLRPQPIAVLGGGNRRRTISTRAFPRSSGTISTASSAGAPTLRSTAIAPGASRGRSMRGDARGRAAADRPPRLHDVSRRRVPGQIAGEDARPARCRTRRRGNPRARVRALVPASSGALDGRLAGAGRRRKMECG